MKIQLVEGGGGNFIVHADGRELWHKRQMANEFPESAVILEELESSD